MPKNKKVNSGVYFIGGADFCAIMDWDVPLVDVFVVVCFPIIPEDPFDILFVFIF